MSYSLPTPALDILMKKFTVERKKVSLVKFSDLCDWESKFTIAEICLGTRYSVSFKISNNIFKGLEIFLFFQKEHGFP